MLQVSRIDVPTGLTLQETIEETQQPKTKQVEHSYLEHWLKTHDINAQFHTGRFYDGVNEADRLRLEGEGKVLVFTNGKDGYFTDPNTAQLMTTGDLERGISPIYAGDRNSPHNFVAYGSLVASDGMASTHIQSARILVIDDESRSHGDIPLLDKNGQSVPQAQLEKLYDKMGDGTMLVPQVVMESLITPAEREDISKAVFEKAGISADITEIANELPQLDSALEEVERQVKGLATRTATQFRAATLDLPGLIKGTMASSYWCDRLGVDAIISSNDIKGDDGRLSKPGIKMVSDFWLNRKSDGRYGEQAVGPQIKGCIPEATLREFNPRTKAQAEALVAVAADPIQLSQYYMGQKERQRERLEVEDDGGNEEATQQKRSDWLYEVLRADRYGQLTHFSKVNKELQRYLKGEWLDNALRGIYVPSAMAQNHAQLQPWEVCNKDLPHGAIVAYYRSPFPNVGAAAIAINNIEIIKQQDREAYSKNGVAYLPPWTAKNVAITDFDRDANGYFVGYKAAVPDLPQQIRQQLAAVKTLPLAEQYEAGRALFAQMIQRLEQGQEPRLAPADYPLAVKEFVERNAPDQKPPEIVKQKKVKHPWYEEESHSAATWRAWGITADNPTGKVANAGMTLQSLALEMTYAPDQQKEALLKQISAHYSKQLKRVEAGKLTIPEDERLQAQGFPAYHLKERIDQLALSGARLAVLRDPQRRDQFVKETLQMASSLLSDIVNGPNAENLQTAVDTAKSSRGIDESIQILARALSYKDHHLRQHHRDPDNYTGKKILPTNTQEPIGWGVEAVNRLYQEIKLPEVRNEAVRDLFPKACTAEQEDRALTIARTYNTLIEARQQAQDRLRENRPEDQRSTLLVTAASGRTLVIQNLHDPEGASPIWRAAGPQPDWTVTVKQDAQATSDSTRFPASLIVAGGEDDRCPQHLGYVSVESAAEYQLASRLKQSPQTLVIQSPIAQIQAPFAQQNDADELIARAMQYVKDSVAEIPKEERPAYLSALWRQSDGMGFALKQFTDLVSDRLQQPLPEIVLTGIQHSSNQAGQLPSGEYTARFSEFSYEKKGETRTCPSIAIVTPAGKEQQFGALSARSIHLPLETTVTAHIEIDPSGKTARMQVIDLMEAPAFPAVSLPKDCIQQLSLAKNVAESPTAYGHPKDGVISGKPVQMVFPLKLYGEPNPLPVDTCIEAMRGYGRCHTTRTFEPYAAYGFQQGEIAIAYAGTRQVAFRVGEQSCITPAMMADPNYQQQWAAMEKHSAQLLQTFQGKAGWGLKMEPLGDYVNDQIIPFPDRTQEIYSPSRQELRQWCAVAVASEDEALKAQIVAKGQQLKALYSQETGVPNATPPLDYRHPLVIISDQDRTQMQHDIQMAREILRVAETFSTPTQPIRPPQMEVG